MRPIRLATKAFGPYAAEQVIDFRDLGDRSLFLIHGPTGGGKTSILDAICFALYGVCSGAHRDAKQVRSDHADPAVATEVTFDFSLSGEFYRVYRKPEQTLVKKKDGRATSAKSDATLFKRTGLESDTDEGTVLATHWKRVTEELEKLIGFRSDQFRQVIMLPQGEFRRLLLADSKDRQSILEVLFGTELYRRIEEALKNAAREVEHRIKDAEKRLKFILEQAGAESEEQLKDLHARAHSRCKEVSDNLEKLKQTEIQAQNELNKGRAAVEILKELDTAEKSLAVFEKQSTTVNLKRDSLNAARRAAVLEPEEKALATRIREADESTGQLKKCRETLSEALAEKEKAERNLKLQEQKQSVVEELRMELGRLEALIPRVRELDEIQKKTSVAGKDFLVKDQALEDAKQAAEKYRSDLEKILPQRELAEKSAARSELLQLKVRELEQAHQVRIKLRDLKEDESREMELLKDAGSRLSRAETDLTAAIDEHKRFESQWIEGQAATLAARLIPGEPCPVCGSREHPIPASLDHAPADTKQLKAKAAKVDRSRALVDEIRQEKNSIEIRLSKIRADADARAENLGDFASKDSDEIETDLKNLRKELKSAEAAAKKIVNLTQQIEHLEKSISEASRICAQAEELRNESMLSLQKLQVECAALKGQLPEGFQDISALEQAITQNRKRIKTLEGALDAAREATARANEQVHGAQAAVRSAEDNAAVSSNRVMAQREDFGRNLVRAGFADAETFRAAKRSPGEIRGLEKDIESFDKGISSAKDRLDRAKLRAENVSKPDLNELERAAAQARTALESALKEEATLAAKLKQIARSLDEHGESSSQIHSLEEEYSVIGRISQAANGVNKDGITFQRFVLAALLDDVLHAASKRFRIMTNSRFHLQRVAKRSDRRMPGGLDLEVHDSYTGSTRPVYTLSGGESFLASLSLALGLADVVQGYAGGIHLDTIFVDEGFGSLDPESLDLALKALMDLRQDGRLVGIISHVPELTERIDARLEVKTGRAGSSARFVV